LEALYQYISSEELCHSKLALGPVATVQLFHCLPHHLPIHFTGKTPAFPLNMGVWNVRLLQLARQLCIQVTQPTLSHSTFISLGLEEYPVIFQHAVQ
jgi:hypothetical protein